MQFRTVTVVWGAETFTPVAYNTFTVGPFTKTINIPEDAGEQYEDQEVRKAYASLSAFAEKAKAEKFKAFLSSLKAVGLEVQAQKGK